MIHESAERPSAEHDVGGQLTRVISLLVDTPGAIHVTARPGRAVTVFEVRADPDDLGQLIGRQGRTARALRTMLDIRGSRDGRRYGLEIREH